METIIFTVVLLLVVWFILNKQISKRNQKNLQKFALTCNSFDNYFDKFYLFRKSDGSGIVDEAANVLLEGYTRIDEVFAVCNRMVSRELLQAIICEKNGLLELRDCRFQLIFGGYTTITPIYVQDGFLKKADYYKVERGGLYGVISHKGQVIVPCKFTEVNFETFSSSAFSMMSSNDTIYTFKYIYFIVEDKLKKGVYDKKGKQIVPCEYEFIFVWGYKFPFLKCYTLEKEIVVINDKGEVIVPTCSKVIDITKYGEFIRRNGKYLFTRKGKTIIESETPLKYCKLMPKKITDGKIIYDLNGNIV